MHRHGRRGTGVERVVFAAVEHEIAGKEQHAARPGDVAAGLCPRQPEDGLWAALEGRPGTMRVGDVLGPRTLEEAILEGFLAGRAEPAAQAAR